MTKSDVISNKLEKCVVMPDNQGNFKKWLPTLSGTDVVNVNYPHKSHGLARKPTNSAKVTVREQFLEFLDQISQPNVIQKQVLVAGIVQPLDVMPQATKMLNDSLKDIQQELVTLFIMESVDHCDITTVIITLSVYTCITCITSILYFSQ